MGGAILTPFLIGIPFLVIGIKSYKNIDNDEFMLWGTSAHHEQLRARYRERLEKESGENGRVFYCEHRLGLPVAEGAKISINMTDASYTFRATNDETWELPKSRITNVSKMTETEIQTHLKSSLGTTILGGAVAGFPGAFVGSLVINAKKCRGTFLLLGL